MKEPIETVIDHIDDDNYQHVDCYFTEDPNEEGKTVAIVCLDTGKVFFLDNLYRSNKGVQEAIKEIKRQANSEILATAKMVLETFVIGDYPTSSDDVRFNRVQTLVNQLESQLI